MRVAVATFAGTRLTISGAKELDDTQLADVLTYCYLLAARLGADPDDIVLSKLEVTRAKYPVEKARGRSAKYDEL